MKVAVVHSFYDSTQPSGENAVVLDQVSALTGAGHEVRLLARETDRVRDRRLYSLRSAATVITGIGPDPSAELRAFSPDVVHVHNTFPNWGASGLRRWSPRLVATMHNYRPLCAAATLFRDGAPCHECLDTPVGPAIRHRCYRDSRVATIPLALGSRPGGPARRLLIEAAAVTALNEQACAVYENQLKRPVSLIPNFVDTPPTQDATGRRGWVYVGRFSPEKGVLQLIRDWPPDHPLDVIGSGPQESEIRHAAAANAAIQLLPPMERGQLRRRLAGYTGLVLPSLCAEGLPTAVLEGLAVGTPAVVSSSVAAGPTLHASGVVERYDAALGPSELVRATSAIQLAGDTMRRRARAVHAANYSREAWLRSITGLYEGVTAGSRAVS